MGASFPLVAQSLDNNTDSGPRRWSVAYNFNLVRAVLAALLAPYLILPKIGLRGSMWLCFTICASIAVAVQFLSGRRPAVRAAGGLVMWRGRLSIAIVAMVLSGLLLSYHALIMDAVLLIPAGLLLLRDKASLAHRAVRMILLSPLPFLGFELENPPYPPAALVLLPLLAMAAVAMRRGWRLPRFIAMRLPQGRQSTPAIPRSSLPRRLPAAAPGRTWPRADGAPASRRWSS
jgi:hypothetical protein